MKETDWVELVAAELRSSGLGSSIQVETGLRLSYGYEILACDDAGEPDSKSTEFQTDLALVERLADGRWKPRVVVEAKLASITTHDAITYSHKAGAHKAVHPYLRYGIMLGHRRHYPLPGRLYRHGSQFDFMASFRGFEPTADEMRSFLAVLRAEIRASRTLEKLIYESRKPGRDRYSILHRKLVVERSR